MSATGDPDRLQPPDPASGHDMLADGERILAEAAALAEEWLVEADDEWHAIVDRAARCGEAAAIEAADAARDRIIAAAEAERDRLHEVARRERDEMLAAARDEAAATVREARRAARRIIERAEQDAVKLRAEVVAERHPEQQHVLAAQADLADLIERSRRLAPAVGDAVAVSGRGTALATVSTREPLRVVPTAAPVTQMAPIAPATPVPPPRPAPVVDIGRGRPASRTRRVFARLFSR